MSKTVGLYHKVVMHSTLNSSPSTKDGKEKGGDSTIDSYTLREKSRPTNTLTCRR